MSLLTTRRYFLSSATYPVALCFALSAKGHAASTINQLNQVDVAQFRSELLNLVKKSKGRPDNLAQRDRTRLKHLVGKAIRG